jgi:hypothetical protein
MARIELRDCTIVIKDGLAGTALINEMSAMAGDTSLTIDNVSLNTTDTDLVPVGARFTVAGETAATTVHIVTARTGNPTTAIDFTPALTAGTYAENNVLTFAPQEVEITVGDGDVTYSEKNEYLYDLDRGSLDTVREGDDQPLEVTLDFVYEHITTGTSEAVSPMDALKRKGGAAEWVSAAADLCEPYAVDIEIHHAVPCGTNQDEITTFPDFRSDQRDVSFNDAVISITGRCNVTEPIVTRE